MSQRAGALTQRERGDEQPRGVGEAAKAFRVKINEAAAQRKTRKENWEKFGAAVTLKDKRDAMGRGWNRFAEGSGQFMKKKLEDASKGMQDFLDKINNLQQRLTSTHHYSKKLQGISERLEDDIASSVDRAKGPIARLPLTTIRPLLIALDKRGGKPEKDANPTQTLKELPGYAALDQKLAAIKAELAKENMGLIYRIKPKDDKGTFEWEAYIGDKAALDEFRNAKPKVPRLAVLGSVVAGIREKANRKDQGES